MIIKTDKNHLLIYNWLIYVEYSVFAFENILVLKLAVHLDKALNCKSLGNAANKHLII